MLGNYMFLRNFLGLHAEFGMGGTCEDFIVFIAEIERFCSGSWLCIAGGFGYAESWSAGGARAVAADANRASSGWIHGTAAEGRSA
jgi:hypothetical protein